MQDRYKKIIEECALAQVECVRESLHKTTDWIIDDQNIDDTDYNAVHSAVMQRTIELLTV